MPRFPQTGSPGFTKLPKVAALGLLPCLTLADLCVLLAICEHLPHAFPSTTTLAKRCGLSTRAVYKARDRLKQFGLITWSKPCSTRRSCKYEVHFDARPPNAASEATFTRPLRKRSSQPTSHDHARDERSFSQSKAKQEDALKKTREQDGVEGVDFKGSQAIDTGTDLPDAGVSEIFAARDALRYFGIKTRTIDLLIARCPWLLPETVHGLVEIVRERDARNPQGLLVKLIREEGARVTRDIRAARTVVSHGSPDDETATASESRKGIANLVDETRRLDAQGLMANGADGAQRDRCEDRDSHEMDVAEAHRILRGPCDAESRSAVIHKIVSDTMRRYERRRREDARNDGTAPTSSARHRINGGAWDGSDENVEGDSDE